MAKKSEQILTPLDEITDGQRFQQIVAEFFRCFKTESHNYSIVDVNVEDSGIGTDGGCDILVEFVFEDIISKHTQKWIIECKCHKSAIGVKDINANNINMILKGKKADGYLLVCKKDASSSLKKLFKENNEREEKKYYVWNGDQFWRQCIKFKSLIEAFFPDYYNRLFVKDEEAFSALTDKFEKEGGVKQ